MQDQRGRAAALPRPEPDPYLLKTPEVHPYDQRLLPARAFATPVPPQSAGYFAAVTARAAVLTISTRVARGESEDASGPALVELCERAGLEVTHETVGDDREAIAAAIRRLTDEQGARFVFTTGGTGMTPDDVTPEATRDVIEREAPGYAETIRAESRGHTPLGILTRGVSGLRGRALVVNFPGNPKAITQSWPVVEPTLKHAAETLERE
jgi:molybdopterin adenylyltransferase